MPALAITPEVSPGPMATQVSKHVRQKPSLKRKRPMDIDLASNAGGSSPKRSVTFSDQVEISSSEHTKAPEEIQLEVRIALENHAHGDDGGYLELVDLYKMKRRNADGDRPGPETLRLYTAAIASNLSLLDRSCTELVRSLLDFDWLLQNSQYIAMYIRLLGGLVSSYGSWLVPTMKMLTRHFSEVTPLQADVRYPSSRHEGARYVHEAVKYLLQLMPSASQVLASAIANNFPHSSQSRRRNVRYVRNLLMLQQYAPELRSEVMALIIERIVKIDVEVQVAFEDLADDIGDDILHSLANLEEQIAEEVMDDETDEEDSDEEIDVQTQKLKSIKENMGKLDVIMDILFTSYSAEFETPSSNGAAAASMLVSHFTSVILPTYRSRHTQFLLFHFMQSSPALIDQFLGTCIHLILDKNRPSITRQSAAAYLASFVARGLHVPKGVTRDVFAFISEELTKLRRAYEPDCRGPDPRRYHTYYALVQALLYIFCFRWRDLANDEDDLDRNSLSPPHVSGSNFNVDGTLSYTFPTSVKEALSANTSSPLNPLRVCAPAIVAEFNHTTFKLSLIYVNHIIERNKRVRLFQAPVQSHGATQRETALSARKDEDWMRLDGYFPFDPYRLPASKHWIEGDYRDWEGLGDEEDEDDESEEDDEVVADAAVSDESDSDDD